jgi:deoxyadenosine/deoxycytidine kinase
MHVAFEGPIGAGKTTLAQLYADQINARIVLEDFDSNPFLAEFYGNKERWRLAMQLWFLSDRHSRLSELLRSSATPVVADHTMATDGIFAQLLLDGRDLELYKRISLGLSNTVPEPDIVVLVDARNEVLLERIAQRGRPYETVVDSQYLDALRSAYGIHYSSSFSTIIRVDSSDLDLTSEAELHQLYMMISAAMARLRNQSSEEFR